MKRILVINPGSTSTKIAVYMDEAEVFSKSVEHTEAEIARYGAIVDQLGFRTEAVLAALKEAGVHTMAAEAGDSGDAGMDADADESASEMRLDVVVGRGGMISAIEGGGYLVNEALKDIILHGLMMQHASNLGALIADAIAAPLGIPAYIYDAVGSDEMYEVAHVTGLPEIIRYPYSHVLNTKAMARKYAESIGKRYDELNLIACHVGGGGSVNAHMRGRIVDSIADDDGPFSMERTGGIPLSYVVNLAYSGKYTEKELMKMVRGMGGVKAHLGTHDLREVERRIAAGDEKARLIHDALAYQIAKGIGMLAPVLKGDIDAIILTGGTAYSEILMEKVKERVSFIAPVIVLPGENEMEALAFGALRILNGEEPAKEY